MEDGSRRRRERQGNNGDAEDDGTWESKILNIIYGHYKEALNALPLGPMPALAPSLLDAGVCFGFADPVTNIITNTVLFLPDEDGEPEPNGSKKRKRTTKASRERVLSEIFAGDVPNPLGAGTIAERSLDGLVSFLTSYFCHLPSSDAMDYLFLARADLLVAIYLIERDRLCCRKDKLDIRSEAVRTALRCAASSARIVNVDDFIMGSFALVPHLDSITQVENRCCLSVKQIRWMSRLLEKPLKLKMSDNPMHLAPGRYTYTHSNLKEPCGLMESLRGVLLDKIHFKYLKAMSMIPMKELRLRYHRSLLRAGYCYGPFSLVSNIIANTIWYDTTFPATAGFEVDMIHTMTRFESRTLDGLIKLLQVCIPYLSEIDAMQYLLENDLDPHKAIRLAKKLGNATLRLDERAYKAAAHAASHPVPDLYVEFVSGFLPTVRSAVQSLLQPSRILSSREVLGLSKLLSRSKDHPARSLELAVELTKDAIEMISNYKETFITRQGFVRGKVEAALLKYKQITGHRYKLQIICGLNENVGNKRWIRDSKRQYSHANFWAKRIDETTLTLFFAEFSNDEDAGNDQTFCYPLSHLSTNARCSYCDFEGTGIAHPNKSYCGESMDFEKIACGDHRLNNAKIISHGELMACPLGIYEEDYIYLDPAQDTNLVRDVNHVTWELSLGWEEESKMIEKMEVARRGLLIAH